MSNSHGKSISEQVLVAIFASPAGSPVEGIEVLSMVEHVEQTNCFPSVIPIGDHKSLVFGKTSQSTHGRGGSGNESQITVCLTAAHVGKAFAHIYDVLKMRKSN